MYVSLGANVSLLQADNVYEGIYLSFGGFLCGSQGIHDLINFRENGSVAIMGKGGIWRNWHDPKSVTAGINPSVFQVSLIERRRKNKKMVR